ncbi:MAG TPA: substrate-binding domain-containing protein [Bacillota bacterium]|nr:substrate-binding domain-containing protein [Bacillota bacterium]
MKKRLIAMLVLVMAFSVAIMPQVGAKKKIVLGYSVQDLGNQYWVSVADGIKSRAKELGVDVVVLDARTDPNKQLSQVEDLLQQKVNVLLLSPWDPDSASTGVKAANKKKIPVVVLDVGVSSGKIATFIVSDNLKGGEIAGDYISKLIGGKGKVAHIQCQLGYKIPALRGEGFTKIMKKKGIQIVAKQPADSQRSLGMTVMQNILQAHPDITAVFAENDEMALGAMEAIKAARKQDQIKVVGFDGTGDAITSIKNGEMAGTVAQQPYEMGRMGVDAAMKVLKKKKLNPTTYVPVKLITKENAK